MFYGSGPMYRGPDADTDFDITTTIHIQIIDGADHWIFGCVFGFAEYMKAVLKETDCPPLPTTLTPDDVITGTCPCTIVFDSCPS